MELMGRLASTTLSGSLLLIAATTGLTVLMSEVGINAAETSATEPKQAMFRTQAEAEAAEQKMEYGPSAQDKTL